MTAVTEATFAAAMAAMGPFESRPALAVALSGGADSMALALLARAWTMGRGGDVVCLSVDHRLRKESTEEAAIVAAWMDAIGIEHHILTVDWKGTPPATGIQARAREARYALLRQWCRERGLLHLLLGHHRRDQAETVAMRQAGKSGRQGLAGMSAIIETADVRLLRPLLGVAGDDLRAFLRQKGHSWINDPSNEDPRFARVRMRRQLADCPELEEELMEISFHAGVDRAGREVAAARLLARACEISPDGTAVMDGEIVKPADAETAIFALSGLLAAIGGGSHRPGQAALASLHRRLLAEGNDLKATLGGCRIRPKQGRMWIAREGRRRRGMGGGSDKYRHDGFGVEKVHSENRRGDAAFVSDSFRLVYKDETASRAWRPHLTVSGLGFRVHTPYIPGGAAGTEQQKGRG